MQTVLPKSSPTEIESSASKSPLDIKSDLTINVNVDGKKSPDDSFTSTSSLSSTPKLKIEEDSMKMDDQMEIDDTSLFGNNDDQNSEFKLEKMDAGISIMADIDESSNSSDSFKDSFLRGSSAEEVFDKLKKEEQINNSRVRNEDKTEETISRIIENLDSEAKMEPEDQNPFNIPDNENDTTNAILSNGIEPEIENGHVEEILDQKENVIPSTIRMVNNVSQIKALKVAKEIPSSKISGPRLLYEIQSQDGFTYKSTSISEIWEKLFEAVQIARKAHGLSPLPVGPLADMCGYQMMGLKTNAMKYLLEQLPGVERCTNYTPIYHKRAESTISQASSSGYWSDCDEIKENTNGTARCERYKGRSEYDMFGWLASRHRKQPVQISIPPNGLETETLVRRGSGSNLPMAMRYRTLKETYKDSVGVYRSHIHGRGLFCNRDIEAGEYFIISHFQILFVVPWLLMFEIFFQVKWLSNTPVNS